MLNRPARLTASVAAILTATAAFAEPTIEELDMRMRAMENTMQSILELLEQQQASSGAPASAPPGGGEEMPTATPVGYQMGAVYLDVFTTQLSEDQVKKMRYDPNLLPDGPNGVPSGSALISATKSFAYGAFTREASLSSFAKADVDLHRFCSGLLRAILAIKETGYGSDTQ